MSVTLQAGVTSASRGADGLWTLTIQISERQREEAAALALIDSDFEITVRTPKGEPSFQGWIIEYSLDKFGDWYLKLGVDPDDNAAAAALSTHFAAPYPIIFEPVENDGLIDLGE